jgi:carboxyl-terminal processing protease
VASQFLDGGEVFSAKGRTLGNTQRYNADPGEFSAGVPIVVITNSRSASAAEILAGAIQDRGRGIVIGRRSFGKGSVQSVIPLSDENGALRLTTQRYYTPSGKSIQGRGIMPDMLVAFRPDTGDTRKRFREDSLPNALQNPDDTDFEEDLETLDYPPADWPETEDYQLQKAIELVKSPRYQSFLTAQK